MSALRLFSHGCLLTALCLTVSCKDNFNSPVDHETSEQIIAAYVRNEMKWNSYTLYLYADQNHSRIRLTDSVNGEERVHESNPAYVYFLDEEPDLAWPHACRSVWIDRSNGTLSVHRGENPLHGSTNWLLINNLYNEKPRMGLSGRIIVNHPEGVVQPCLYYRIEEDQLYMEHQCLQISPNSSELSITNDQSGHQLHITAEDLDSNNVEPLQLKHYGFQIHLDSLYIPIDSVHTQRLNSIPVHYQLKRGSRIINSRSFDMPTSGSGKINL